MGRRQRWKLAGAALALGGIAAVAALALSHPKLEWRAAIVRQKIRGELPETPWKEVVVRLAPDGWRYRIRSLTAQGPPPWIRKLDFPIEASLPFTAHEIFRGSTALLRRLDCHFSVLESRTRPHPPHRHEEEELIIPISGAVDIVRVGDDGAERIERIARGQFVYHQANALHTIEAADVSPSTYLVFKWRGHRVPNLGEPLRSTTFDFRPAFARQGEPSGALDTELLFESPTLYLAKLHSHASVMNPAEGYEPHPDPYDVAIFTLEGQVETLGNQVGPNQVIFYPAGEPHGMRNVGSEPARYLVFEFHL